MTSLPKILKQGRLLLALCALASSLDADDTYNTWFQADLYFLDLGSVRSFTHSEHRFDEDFEHYYSRFSQKFSTSISEHWSLGLHPVYERLKDSDGDYFGRTRMDLEIAGRFQIDDHWTLSTRTRLDARWQRVYEGRVGYRFWNRGQLTYRTDWLPGMTSATSMFELNYLLSGNHGWDIRWDPIRLNFSANEHFDCAIGYKMRATTSPGRDWNRTHVLHLTGKVQF